MGKKIAKVTRLSGLMFLIIIISVLLVITGGCFNRSSSAIWIAIPDCQLNPETINAAEVTVQVLNQIEPSARVGLIVGLGNSQSLSVAPATIGASASHLLNALNIISSQAFPITNGTTVLTGISPPSGKLILIAPDGFAMPSLDEISPLSSNGVQLYLISENTSVSETLTTALKGQLFSPQDAGGLAFAIARASSAVLGTGGQIQSTNEAADFKFTVPPGGDFLLALPSTASWHVLDNQANGDKVLSWDISGETLMLVKQEGPQTLFSSAVVMLQPTTEGKSPVSFSPVWIVGIVTAVAVALLFLVVFHSRSTNKKIEPHAILRIAASDSAPAMATITKKGLLVGTGTPPPGKDFFKLAGAEQPDNQLSAEWILEGRDVMLIPHVSVNINGHATLTPRKINIGDMVNIGDSTITLVKMYGN